MNKSDKVHCIVKLQCNLERFFFSIFQNPLKLYIQSKYMCKYNTINNIMGNDKKKLNKKIHAKQKYLKSFVITAWAG